MFNKLNSALRVYRWLASLERRADSLDLPTKSDYKHSKVLTGTLLSRLNLERVPRELREVEFQVFSQFGDDGIIQYLVHSLPIRERTFVEFGVENYTEANTRFLLVKDKWAGLVLDGSRENIDYINGDLISLFYDLRARQAFVTAENINGLLKEAGFVGKIGFLSIDIDGMDYWVWQAMTAIDPAIVVIEYNATFGPDRAITVPYRADFVRAVAHASRLYWGASLMALRNLGTAKGYTFIGCNASGNNAYFVRNEYASLSCVSGLEKCYNPATFAEYVVNGSRVRGGEVLDIIRGLSVYNIRSGNTEPL
jgi:hypothetical protein